MGIGVGGAIVVGNVKAMGATVAGSSTPCPSVGKSTVNEFPAAASAFKVVGPTVANVLGHSSGGEVDYVTPLALVAAATVRFHAGVVSRQGSEVTNG